MRAISAIATAPAGAPSVVSVLPSLFLTRRQSTRQARIMPTRASLWSLWTLPAWVLFVWSLLAHGSTAQFAVTVFAKVSQFLDNHAWVGFLLGFAWLMLVIKSPDLKRRLPSWVSIPKTPNERLLVIEREKIPEIIEGHSSIKSRLDDIEKRTTQNANAFHELATLCSSSVGTMNEMIENTGAYHKTVESRLDDLHAYRMKMIDTVPALDRRISASERMVRILPDFSMAVSEFAGLLLEASLCIDMFREIQLRYPSSPVSTAPFSGWRKQAADSFDEPSEDVRAGLIWARFLERHIGHVNNFCIDKAMPIIDGKHPNLYVYIREWGTASMTIDAKTCLSLFLMHREDVKQMFTDYATRVKSEIFTSAAA